MGLITLAQIFTRRVSTSQSNFCINMKFPGDKNLFVLWIASERQYKRMKIENITVMKASVIVFILEKGQEEPSYFIFHNTI
jgi:hypothetical protein